MLTPNDFVKSIQSEAGQTIPFSVPTENFEYEEIVKSQFEKYGLPYNKPGNNLEILIEHFWEDLEVLDKNEIALIKEKVGIGIIKYDKISACITKGDKFYAVLFHHGLFSYLNKNLKLLHASQNPEDVLYCNRISQEEYSREVFFEYWLELSSIYKEYRRVSGALIVLKPNKFLTIELYIIELFILCHELGHFFNGDLERQNVTSRLFANREEEVLSVNEHHRFEYEADIKGFQLMAKILKEKHKDTIPFILPSLIMAFNIFAMLGNEESATHPKPHDRLLNIIKTFYGEEAYHFISKTYDNPEFLRTNLSRISKIQL